MSHKPNSLVRRGYLFLAKHHIVVLLIVLVVVIQSQADGFLRLANIRGIALDGAILAIVAVPSALLIISGYFDLSVGSTLALGAVVSGTLMASGQTSPTAAILAAVLAGSAVGLILGVLTCYGKMSAFIVTLGALTAVRGVALLISPQPSSGYGDAFAVLGTGRVGEIPLPVILALVVILLGGTVLALTPWGRHIFALGVNEEAARLSGLATRRIPVLLYVLTGAAAGLGGAITASRLDAAPAGSIGLGFELTVLTAVLLGGVTFTGGSGSIFGVFLGVIFLGVLTNGLTILGVTSAWQQVATGGALILAIALSMIPEPQPRSRPTAPDTSPNDHAADETLTPSRQP